MHVKLLQIRVVQASRQLQSFALYIMDRAPSLQKAEASLAMMLQPRRIDRLKSSYTGVDFYCFKLKLQFEELYNVSNGEQAVVCDKSSKSRNNKFN